MPELQGGINENTFSENIPLTFQEEEDIFDDKIYSIQEAKLLAEEDAKKSLADKKKVKVLNQISKLREAYQALREAN